MTTKNRDFERHGVYTPRNLNYNNETKFRFKNSLVITPFYETEFYESGGIKYIKNHEEHVFFTNCGIFATTNNIQKIPVLTSRGINKQSIQTKLIIEEKYNYEEKYNIQKNIILYYNENRIDFQILFEKTELNTKDITTDFSLNLIVPESGITTYKKYSEKQEESEIPHGNLEYITVNRKGSFMTLYPGKNLSTEYKNKSLSFTASNIFQPAKNHIDLKIYLENYRIT